MIFILFFDIINTSIDYYSIWIKYYKYKNFLRLDHYQKLFILAIINNVKLILIYICFFSLFVLFIIISLFIANVIFNLVKIFTFFI